MKKKINNLIAAFLVMAVGVMGIGTVYAEDANTGTPNIDGSTSLPGGSSSTSGTNSSTSGNNSSTSGGSNSTSDAAASLVTVGCNSTELAVGGTTVCTVYVTPSAALAASTTAVKNVKLNVSQSKYLTMSGINPAAGFTLGDHDEDNKALSKNTIELTYTATDANPIVANKKMEIMSFNLKLEEAAANVTSGECGELCISGVVFDSETTKVGDDGSYCPKITIVKKNCKDEECNPTTGEFMNYAVIAGVATVALVSIAIISKKKKFYNV